MHECASHGAAAFSHLSECYLGLKDRLRLGRDLTDAELEFIGFATNPRPRDGWRDASRLGVSFEVGLALSAEDAVVLQSLMGVEYADATEFLR